MPRPAMFVAIVTAPERPAWATTSASRLVELGVQHVVLDAAPLQQSDSISETSTLIVPTRIGRPFSCSSAISSITEFHLPDCLA